MLAITNSSKSYLSNPLEIFQASNPTEAAKLKFKVETKFQIHWLLIKLHELGVKTSKPNYCFGANGFVPKEPIFLC